MTDYSRALRSARRLGNLNGKLPVWYKIENNAGGPAQVAIYDEIGMYGCSAQSFITDLGKVKGDLDVHVNSPGGDVFDGMAIYNRLVQHDGQVRVIVDGLAASAASFIAQAAAPGFLEIAPGARMMIHNGFAQAIGDASDLRKTADLLDGVTEDIARIYATRTGLPVSHWLSEMALETWYRDSEAVTARLADRVQGDGTGDSPWDLSVFSSLLNSAGNNGWVRRDGKWVFDPDGDGDDDGSPSGDTDHEYWSPDGRLLKDIPPDPEGKQGMKAQASQRPSATLASNSSGKYSKDDRDKMAGKEAMPDGSYPVKDEEDLDNAIHAVGRGGSDHDSIRKHVIERAHALGLSAKIPPNWNSDGSLKTSGSPDDVNGTLLSAFFSTTLGGVN